MAPLKSKWEDKIIDILKEGRRYSPSSLHFEILDRLYNLPSWMKEAVLNGWHPPVSWKKKEREEISNEIRRMISSGKLFIDMNWSVGLSSCEK